MLDVLGKRQIGIYLLIDFRKAFDLINPRLLLTKLRRYGFDKSALDLMLDYFTDRTQTVKHDGFLSSALPIELGIPQGSVLGPLLFLIYINDLPFFVDQLKHKLFADDTTIVVSSNWAKMKGARYGFWVPDHQKQQNRCRRVKTREEVKNRKIFVINGAAK